MKQIKYLIVCLQGSQFLRSTYCNMNVQHISKQLRDEILSDFRCDYRATYRKAFRYEVKHD
nr:MAG TPA: hypothetical protein [Caudoviricetes sp.]